MNNGRFAINIHILSLLSMVKEEWVSSANIASSININPVLVRKEIANLCRSGMVQSKEGKNGGGSLAKPANSILLSDVYKAAIERPLLSFSKNEPNRKCPIGKQINDQLNILFVEAENAMLTTLGNTTLQQFIDKFK